VSTEGMCILMLNLNHTGGNHPSPHSQSFDFVKYGGFEKHLKRTTGSNECHTQDCWYESPVSCVSNIWSPPSLVLSN